MLKLVTQAPCKTHSKQITLNTTRPRIVTQPTYPTADTYKQYDHRTHVYMKPDTYIGADERVEREEWLYNMQTGRMMNATIDFVPGCERLYLEVLTNASDNVGRSRRAGVDPGKIDITMNNKIISVTNYGLPIPVEMHPKEGVYVPQMIFGSLLTSSNYEVDRHEAGTNGIGAKAANIFSKWFKVTVLDHIRHRKYTQIWRDNMTVCEQPTIQQYNGTISSVQVEYEMDFARFSYPVPNGAEGGYPPEAFVLFCRHAIDISFTAKTTVTFNGTEFNFANIREYARLYFGDAVDTAIVHYQWPPNTEVVNKKKGYQVAQNPAITPEIELIAIDTPDEGHHVSFVNCMMTRDGGVHVNAAVKSVGDSAVKMINESVIKQLTKQNKGKELDAKEKRAHTITINDVKPHISILLAVKVMNPKFTSQTKTMLHSPVPKISIEESTLNGIHKWQLIDRLYAALEAKQFATLAKTDGKLRKYLKLKKGIDANNAGKADRHRCVLYITEGKSAKGYANTLISLVPGGRDYIGVLPMRGKNLNVMNANRFKIGKNNEINELKEMLGLIDCPDPELRKTFYLDPKNFAKLRYGAVMIMADSDVDGIHIIGLILNIFHCRFPSLLARGFVMYYMTPTIRVTKGHTTHKFYTQAEYEEWKRATPDYATWKHKYYKGLGSSDENEVGDDYRTPRVVTCFYDADAPLAMRLAFDKDLADRRKDWIGSWRPYLGAEEINMQPISWFINNKLILFGIAAVERAIPKLTDGFKESHRKIIYAAHKKWNISPNTKYSEFKVAQFAAYVASQTHYQHGEGILDDVVVGMAQEFIGANNINWFYPRGRFGTRFEGGKDASSSRYLHTHPVGLMSRILRKEDIPILKSVIEEGDEVEPETYQPIVPMILVNGGHGIGMAWSTFIPNHNILDIISWIRMKLQGVPENDLPDVLPWYRGFTGTIKVIDRRRKRRKTTGLTPTVTTVNTTTGQTETAQTDTDIDNVENEALNEEEEEDFAETAGSRPLLSMVTFGKFTIDMSGTIIITELPIGRWPQTYHKWLENLVEEKKITGFRDLSVENRVYFEIYGFTDTPNYNTLKLKRTMGMSNMVLLDENNRPVRYDTTYDILEAFYARRLPVYQERKNYILERLTEEITTLKHKIQFIQGVISGQINIVNCRVADVHAAMDQLNIPHEIYKKSKTRNLSQEEITELTNQIAAKEREYEELNQTSIEQMWLNDLQELETVYRNTYGFKKEQVTLNLKPPKSNFPESVTSNALTVPGAGLQAIGQTRRQATVVAPPQTTKLVTLPLPQTTKLITLPVPQITPPPQNKPAVQLNLSIAPMQ